METTTVSNPPRPVDQRPATPSSARKRWRLIDSPIRGKLQHSGLPKLIAHVLENRGIGSTAEAQLFLGGKSTQLGDPADLPNFDAAMRVLSGAIRDGKTICVYGDFDVDGITSTTILTEALRDLGGDAFPYIPNREREGYGLNVRAIDSLADRGVGVLVTCDCGTTSIVEVEHAHQLGMEVIVVDHHLPPAELPAAEALVNPRLPNGRYGFVEYCTAGLAFRLAEALYAQALRPFPEDRYAELAALGTVADMVPLVHENREVVKRGLAAMGRSERPGLKALMDVAGVKAKNVNSEAIAFSLAPRINAAGRLADARMALEMLLTREEGVAIAMASSIDALNKERQRMTAEAQELAKRIVDARPEAPLIFVGHPEFHQGIIGLVASRLVESFGRPAVVYQQGPEESRGSCRSILPYDITAGLRHSGHLFERFGGHRQAGGFTVRNNHLEELEERLVEHAGVSLLGMDLTPTLDIDAEWPLTDLKGQEIQWLNKLQPIGQGNPQVRLLSRGVLVTEAKTVGDGTHCRLKLKAGATWPAIAFNFEGPLPAQGSCIDLVYTMSSDRFGPSGNGGALQLQVLDMVPTAS